MKNIKGARFGGLRMRQRAWLGKVTGAKKRLITIVTKSRPVSTRAVVRITADAPKKKIMYTSVLAGFVLATAASFILPAMQVSAERSLVWSDTADFTQNKISECQATEISGVVVTGSKYGDETCAEAGEDASIILGGSKPVMLEGVVDISANSSSTLALKEDGTVWAWGANDNGQLGDGTTVHRRLPVQVKDPVGTGFLSGVQMIAAGDSHTLALKTDGTVWAWGYNNSGRLGDDTTTRRTLPVQVKDPAGTDFLSGVQAIAIGQTYSLALKTDGTVWAWGGNVYGQLGDGTTSNRTLSAQVIQSTGDGMLSDIQVVSAGGSHTLALKTDGTVWAWGLNDSGQLGEGSSVDAAFPVQVKDPAGTGFLSDVQSIAAGGSHSLALKADGTLWAWGYNTYGRLGDGTTIQRTLPIQVKDPTGTGFLSGVQAIAAGSSHSLALKTDSTVWAWGENNSRQLGDGTVTSSSLPIQVKDSTGTDFLSGVQTIVVRGTHSLALKTDGTVWGWGPNTSGRLGDGTTTTRSFPVQVKDPAGTGFLSDVQSIAAGGSHSLALKTDGTVWAWGLSNYGQLGEGVTIQRTLPIQVKDPTGTGFLSGVQSIAAGNEHSFALETDGPVWAWGLNISGQLGDNTATNRNLPVAVVGSGGFNVSGSASGYIIDVGLGYRTKWNTLSWQTQPLPNQTSVTFSTRTSHDGVHWSEWESAGVQDEPDSTSHTATLENPTMTRFAEVRLDLFTNNQTVTPEVNDFSLSFLSDTIAPHQNASNIQAYRGQGGAVIADTGWSNIAPYVTWDTAEDEADGSDIWGYCLYLGQDNSANVKTTKGLLGGSPINSYDACQYLTSATSLNLSQVDMLSQNLTSSSDSYYLLIKAIDNVGNIYDGDAEVFEFKYDNVAPKNPSFISAPAGFVSTKNVLLTWPTDGDEAASDDVSGVAGLQYRVGPDGPWYGDGHSGAQDISDLLVNDGSYRMHETHDYPRLNEGNNVIYFRTYDVAGNISSTHSTAAVKINTSAPSQPQNVSATPSVNEVNSFAFSWQKPASYVGSEDGLTYCYTVNVLPAANTCSFVDTPSLAADAFATQPGANTFYVVARDESGNVNYDTYATVSFTANTAAPGAPSSIEIADISTKATSTWKLALSWEKPADTGAGIARYQVHRSTNGTSYAQIATTAGLSYVDAELSQQEYFYKMRACDSANNCGAFSTPVSNTPTGRFTTPPELISSPSVETSTRRASFYWVTDRVSDSRVQYGTESGVYMPGEIAVSDITKTHTVDVNNLDAGTTYYYRVKWTDDDGNTGVSNEYSFKTLPAPVVKSVEVVKSTLTSSIVRVVTRDATRVSLYYGKTESFGGVKSVNTSRTESTYDIQLDGLDDGSKYFFKIVTVDSDGNTYDSNRIDSFSTPPRPRISNLQFQPVEGEPTSTQKVTWTTNVATSSLVTFGQTGTAGSDVYSSGMKTKHEMVINNLADNSDYFLIAQGRDRDGNLAVSDRQVFKTALDTRPPKLSGVRIETSVTGSGQSSQGQIIVYWKTDEPATSQVAYATGSNASEFTNFTAKDARLTTDHIVVISNLSFSTIYSIKPVSEDGSGNQTEAKTQSAIVGRPTESILDIISGALSRLFGL